MLTLIFCLIAYLIGSVCSAIIICRLLGYPDPRSQGSRNPGATNVKRLAGKKVAAMVLVGDLLKGLIAVAIARVFISNELALGMIGFAAVIGHVFPIFFGFKGGKGVATYFGVLLGLYWALGLMTIFIWLSIFYWRRISSLSALISISLSPLASELTRPGYFWPCVLMTVTVLLCHHENIKKLIQGTET